jgi:protein TonB
MFEQTFVDGTGKTAKPWATTVGFLFQILVVGFFVLVPMIWTDVLPANTLKAFLVAPPPPPPPPPPPAEAPKTIAVKVIPRQFDSGRLMQPKAIPTAIAVIKEDELPPPSAGGAAGGMGSGATGGLLSGILSGATLVIAPPPAKKVDAPKPVQRIVVGGNVQKAMLIKQPVPVYPPLARSTRIQGHVILSAVISKDGTISELKLISGHPLLAPAAMAAVKQWVYKPTLLNGDPVEVSTEIDVNFTLQ